MSLDNHLEGLPAAWLFILLSVVGHCFYHILIFVSFETNIAFADQTMCIFLCGGKNRMYHSKRDPAGNACRIPSMDT